MTSLKVRQKYQNHRSYKQGSGIINKAINALPFELHIPSYNFLGPGTKLEERLQRGDKPINKLDAAALEHDIAYSKANTSEDYKAADYKLEQEAWKRVTDPSAHLGERAAAWLTTNLMKLKQKTGQGLKKMNCRRRRRHNHQHKKGGIIHHSHKNSYRHPQHHQHHYNRKIGGAITFQSAVNSAKKVVTPKKDILRNINDTLVAFRNIKKRRNIKQKRIIPIPKKGGFLPLIPIVSGLSAIGSIAGNAKSIYDAIQSIVSLKDQIFKGNKNGGKIGKALHLKPWKTGGRLALYVK